MKLVKKCTEAIIEFVNSKLHGFETYHEVDGIFYKIKVSRISKRKVEELKRDHYI